ncbi:MAG: putative ferric reductase [Sulfurimonas sp.]|jgi:predicted ferric reductase
MGLIMINTIKKYNFISFVIVFIGLPILLLSLSDLQPRSILKNTISIVPLLAFSLILGQFFLSRTNNLTKNIYKFKNVINIHKIIGYFVVVVFFTHPFLIVLPRYFESGPEPIDALIKMITTFESTGVILGLIAWVSMLLLGITSMFRHKLNISYKAWRVFHGLLALLFIVVATWHAVDLGRNTNVSISIFLILAASAGSMLLIKQYIFSNKKEEIKNV